MSDVFVSYSRDDRDVVTPIVEALRAAGEKVWVDLDDIVPSAVWMEEIKNAIAAADSMVFFLTPDSAHSDVCRIELGHALELSKRIVPVVIREVETETVPPPLPDINWHFIRPETFDADVADLVEVLNTDIARVHMHTRLLVRTNEWMARNEHPSLLLRGVQLNDAEQWLAGQGDQKPTTTPDQGRFIAASRRATSRRQRVGVTAAIVITAVMALVATVALVQWRTAEDQRRQATEQRNAAVSREFAAYSRDTVTADPQLGLILALRAYDSSPTQAAQDAVREAVRQSAVRAILPSDLTPRSDQTMVDPLNEDAPETGALTGARGFDRSGNHVLAFGDNSLLVWKWTQRGGQPDIVTLPVDENLGYVWSAEFNREGRVVFTVEKDRTTKIFEWNPAGGTTTHLVGTFELPPGSDGGLVRLSPDGRWALAPNRPRSGVFTLTSLQNPNDPPRTIDVGSANSFSKFSPDGSLLLIDMGEDVAVYRTADTSQMTTYPLGDEHHADMAFRPDNVVLAIARDTEIEIVDLTAEGGPRLTKKLSMATPPGISSLYNDAEVLAWSPNGYALAVGTAGNSIRLFIGGANTPVYLNGDGNSVGGLSFSDDGRYLLSAGSRVEVWDWAAPQKVTYHAAAQSSPPLFTPDGTTVAVTDSNGVLRLDDVAGPGGRMLGEGHPLAFSADGRLLAVEEAAAVSVWDIATSKKLASLPLANPNYGTFPFLVARFNEGGDVLAVMRRDQQAGQAWRWPWRSGEPATSLSGFGKEQGVQAIVGWTPDGQIDLIADSSLYTWDGSHPPNFVATASANFFNIMGSTFLNPSTVLLAYEDKTQQWDTQSNAVTPVLPEYGSTGFALSGDRALIAIAGTAGFVYMWDFESTQPVRVGRYEPQSGIAPHIALNGDGSQLAVTDTDGTHIVPTAFARRFSDVLPLARDLVVRGLTSDEEDRYLSS